VSEYNAVMIKSDAPIKTKKDDLLGRARFSESLGKALMEWQSVEGIVIGLYGKWGSGKSSILNLAIEYIENVGKEKKLKKKDRPIIIRFNPWNFTEQEHLISTFFAELAKAINYYDKGKDAKKVGEKLVTYSKFFSVLSLIPGADPYAKIVENVFKQVGETTKDWGELQTKNLEQYKEELDKAIKKLGRKIIIVIDDIDRLNEREIKQIFQLVKQTANFPNTLYILSLDQRKALEQITESPEFLEKIVQVNFHAPQVEDMRLRRILFQELDSILESFPEGVWDDQRWSTVFHNGYKDIFNSLRGIKRYINSLKFNISINADEINPLDFFVIEAIRVFFPAFYEEIAPNKELFVGLFFMENDRDRELRKKQLERLFELVGEKDGGIVRRLMFELFPQVAAVYRNQTLQEHEGWFKEKRICSEKRFGNYFYLSLAEGEISQSEMNTIIEASDNLGRLKTILDNLLQDGRIRRCLERLPEFIDTIPNEHIENFVLAFYNIADKIPKERKSDIDFGVEMELVRLGYHLIKKLPPSERYAIAANIITKSESLETVVHFTSIEESEHDKNKDELLLTSEETVKLIKIAVAKIKEYVESGKLSTSPGLAYILYRWKRWGAEDEVKRYIDQLVQKPPGIVSLIEGFCARTISSKKQKRSISFKELKDFIDLESLKTGIVKLTPEQKASLTTDHQALLGEYLQGVDKGIRGEDWF
jgi:predicted KAP-like P-loop ATPase